MKWKFVNKDLAMLFKDHDEAIKFAGILNNIRKLQGRKPCYDVYSDLLAGPWFIAGAGYIKFTEANIISETTVVDSMLERSCRSPLNRVS